LKAIQTQSEFISLIQENAGIIHKVLKLYIDGETDREDMYQEIVLQAWKSFGRFKGESKFSTWLYRVSLNTVFTYNRQNRLNNNQTELEEHHSQHVVHKKYDDAELLLVALKKLNEVDRSLITLHLDGYDNAEISEIIGITKNHVGVKIHRIKNELSRRLKELGYEY